MTSCAVFKTALFVLTIGIANVSSQDGSTCLMMANESVRPIVKVFVNGRGPFRFLIDTGGDGDARVSLGLKQELGLPTIRREGNDDSTKKDTKIVDVVKVDSLRVGTIVFQNLEAKSRDYGREIDGILAFHLFRHHLLVLDYANRRVFIGHRTLTDHDSIPFEMPEGTPMIKGKLGKEPLKMDIDTGDDQGVTISEELVSHFTLVAPPTIVGHGTSATHTFDIKQAQVKENLVMGSVVIPSPTVVFSTIFDNVNLGSLLFSHFVVSVDQEHRLLSIQRPKETACTAPD